MIRGWRIRRINRLIPTATAITRLNSEKMLCIFDTSLTRISGIRKGGTILIMKDLFRRFASRVSVATGSAYAFIIAVGVVIFWALSGLPFHFSNTWQLFINTTTTIGTFLMVFLIQNTQNRESKATQLKLDELILATNARDTFIDIEDLTDDELEVINQGFVQLREQISHPAIHKMHKKISEAHQKRKQRGK